VIIISMSYSIDAREIVLKYRDNGHTLEQTFNRPLAKLAQQFKITNTGN